MKLACGFLNSFSTAVSSLREHVCSPACHVRFRRAPAKRAWRKCVHVCNCSICMIQNRYQVRNPLRVTDRSTICQLRLKTMRPHSTDLGQVGAPGTSIQPRVGGHAHTDKEKKKRKNGRSPRENRHDRPGQGRSKKSTQKGGGSEGQPEGLANDALERPHAENRARRLARETNRESTRKSSTDREDT